MPARDHLIVALDVPTAEAGVRVAESLRERAATFKVGAEVFAAEGPLVARHLVLSGLQVFLDLKFHDIPNTVRGAAREAAALGVRMMDVHASGGRKMMEAALEGARQGAERAGHPRPLVLAVTVLTSLSHADLQELGISDGPEATVVRWARLAQSAGLDGVVASAREIEVIRRACGPRFVIVTPGIRLPAAASNDQARTATPAAALQAGADYLVVGRPITQAPDPLAAAQAFLSEMEKGLAARSTQVQNS